MRRLVRPRPASTAPATGPFSRPVSAAWLVNAETESLTTLQYYDYIQLAPSRIFAQISLTNPTRLGTYNTFITSHATANASVSGGTSRSSVGVYMIAFEFGGQVNWISSYTRSGTALTLNLVTETGTPTAPLSGSVNTVGRKLKMFGVNSAWDGVQTTVASTGATSVTVTLPSSTGPASGTCTAAFCAAQFDATYLWMSEFADGLGASNPSFFLRRSGAGSEFTSWDAGTGSSNKIMDMYGGSTTTPNAAGERWHQVHARVAVATMTSQLAGLKWFEYDNYMDQRADLRNGGSDNMDFNCNGTPISRTSSTAKSLHRSWMAAGLQAVVAKHLATTGVTLKRLVNHDAGYGAGTQADGNLPGEFAGSTDWDYLENVFNGMSNSTMASVLSGSNGWTFTYGLLMNKVTSVGASGLVFSSNEIASWSDTKAHRFAFLMCLLHPQLVPIVHLSSDSAVPVGRIVLPEMQVGIGSMTSSAVTSSTTGLKTVTYQNAIVYVNASGSSQSTADLTGLGYKNVSDGSSVTGVQTVTAWDSVMYVRSWPGTV
jgi:hypothetical protein